MHRIKYSYNKWKMDKITTRTFATEVQVIFYNLQFVEN